MKKDTKDIGILKKITTYKKIIKYENDGLSHGEIAKKINLDSSAAIQKIIIWGKTYFRESELLEFNKLSPKASSLLSSNKSIDLYEKSLPENETKLLNLDKLDFFKLPKERIVYLNKLSKALESGNYAKLKLRHLVYFHNKWIDLIINDSEKVKIPYDKYQDSWLFLVAGLDTCSKIFIDKKISIMFMDLKNHILNSKPWYNVESNNNYKGTLRSLINKPIKYVNIIKQDGGKNNPPRWWYFFAIPSNDEIDKEYYMEVKSKRIKSTPVIGKVESIEWEPNENSKKISDNFSDDEEINSLSMELGNIKVQSLHDNFSGFSVELEFKRREKNINNQNWESLNKIAHICLNYKA